MEYKKKLYLKVFAGMGNQLFQCATAIALSYEYKYELIIDDSYYLKRYHPIKSQGFYCEYALKKFINENIIHLSGLRREINGIIFKYGKTLKIYKSIYKLLNKFGLKIPKVVASIEEIEQSTRQDIIMFGYFQSSYLIIKWKEEILSKLTSKINLSKNAEKYKNLIESHKVVSVHFRRGDYVKKANVKEVFSELTLEYYDKAIKYLEDKEIKIDRIIVFSDDIEWVKENYKKDQRIVYVEEDQISDYEQIKLMSMCKNNIIANSTFSWWAAFMNKNIGKIVIAPMYWYRDRSEKNPIMPNDWHMMPN